MLLVALGHEPGSWGLVGSQHPSSFHSLLLNTPESLSPEGPIQLWKLRSRQSPSASRGRLHLIHSRATARPVKKPGGKKNGDVPSAIPLLMHPGAFLTSDKKIHLFLEPKDDLGSRDREVG